MTHGGGGAAHILSWSSFVQKYIVGTEEKLHDNLLNVYINFAAQGYGSFEKFT